jgi:BON domain
MLVGLKRISAALGLLAATAVTSAQGQTAAANPNQATADAVAASLSSSRVLSKYKIEVETRSGQVTLKGAVATPAQHSEAIRRAQQVPGVNSVVDFVQVVGDSRVRAAQYQVMAGGTRPHGGMMSEETMMDGTPGGMINSTHGAAMGGMGGMSGDGPMPEGPAGMTGATQAAMPGYPNYAWPSYAPYPNYSAVGYPTAYPWQAWPNIGPFHPYPEVPLDWRAVTLRWDDGIWWLDFKRNYTRPFFTPYPFGIFGY